MARLIDADKYPCQACNVSYCHQNCEKFIAWFNETVDAVEVVRCKDCICYQERSAKSSAVGYGYCYHWEHEEGMSPNEVWDDDFCSYGRRKERQWVRNFGLSDC